MWTEAVKSLQEQIDLMNDTITKIKETISSASIDHQMYLRSNPVIAPGIACKIGYDKNGLVVNGEKLSISDIPDLPMMKITGLQGSLDKLSNDIEMSKLIPVTSDIIKKTRSVKCTGIKVNYDEDGKIISSSELVIDDIPRLPIEKIIGLKDELDFFKSCHSEDNNDKSVLSDITVNPGTYTKITCDSYGRVVSGSNLSVNDIPMDIILRINNIESIIPTLSTSKVVENISMLVNNKIDGNNPTTPGSYTKVKVDSKGLVISGDKITVDDIPRLPTTKIEDLDIILSQKAYQSDVEDLSNTVARFVNSVAKVSEINTLRERIEKKANDSDLKTVVSRMDNVQDLFVKLQSKIPNELIMEQLQQIQNELSSLSGRVTVLERKIQL